MTRTRNVAACIATSLAFLLLPAAGLSAGPAARDLVGWQAPDFSLPSTRGKLAEYERDYYGKHHLVLTFFPAAFTPV